MLKKRSQFDLLDASAESVRRLGSALVACTLVAALHAIAPRSSAIEPWDFAVLATARVQANPPWITLEWPEAPLAESHIISRKLSHERDWTPLATLSGNVSVFTDTAVVLGAAYEYEIRQNNSDGVTAYGYVYSGIEVPFTAERGRLVLVVDNTHAAELADELARLNSDLIGDGWTILRHDVARSASPNEVKAFIKADYDADPARTKAVFLFGHVPVPYSGRLNPDMHPAHLGAWPADAFYVEMEGEWTDILVNDTSAEDPRNQNVPGDGKFDQSELPGPAALQIGRVDFFDLPAFAPATERDLLRQYLDKNHSFRHKLIHVENRALVRDNFGEIQGDAPATDAWRSFAPLVGVENIREIGPGEFFPTLARESFLWAYGGGGGGYYHADGVGSTSDFAQQSPQCVFFMLHGSFFGDWDSSDNFLRAALATPGYGLAAAWTGLPHWFMHHMGLGETVGFSAMVAQNNRNLYKNQVNLSAGQAHIALMGDPTLRMHVVAPPANLTAAASNGSVALSWTSSPDAVRGYYVFRAKSPSDAFSRLTRLFVTGNSYVDRSPPSEPATYMVRAVALETSSSGSYYNSSQGVFATSVEGSEEPAILSIVRQADESVRIKFSGVIGRSYRVQASKDFQNWTTVGEGDVEVGGAVDFVDPQETDGLCRFYRLEWR